MTTRRRRKSVKSKWGKKKGRVIWMWRMYSEECWKGQNQSWAKKGKECKRDKLQPVRQRGTNPGCSRQGTLGGGGENIWTNKKNKQTTYQQSKQLVNKLSMNERSDTIPGCRRRQGRLCCATGIGGEIPWHISDTYQITVRHRNTILSLPKNYC